MKPPAPESAHVTRTHVAMQTMVHVTRVAQRVTPAARMPEHAPGLARQGANGSTSAHGPPVRDLSRDAVDRAPRDRRNRVQQAAGTRPAKQLARDGGDSAREPWLQPGHRARHLRQRPFQRGSRGLATIGRSFLAANPVSGRKCSAASSSDSASEAM